MSLSKKFFSRHLSPDKTRKSHLDYWKEYGGINDNKYFVAHNTVAIAPYQEDLQQSRSIILFVGTLYKQKGIGELIECYAKAKASVGKLPEIKIIGKGPERESIENLIKELGLEHDIELTGAIYEESILKEYFVKSILCVSPRQAGLTVLKSLGYGVPFITRTDAITGGEKANIQNGRTGLFYDSEEELVEILKQTVVDPSRFAAMSVAARNYYNEEASPALMAKGVIDAINYVMK